MKKFLLFIAGLVAGLVLLANLGPMVLLGLSIWLLYIVFKKFIKSESTAGKVGWVILGLFILSVSFANSYALIGGIAAVALYFIIKNWNTSDSDIEVLDADPKDDNDPFTNFEREWAQLNR